MPEQQSAAVGVRRRTYLRSIAAGAAGLSLLGAASGVAAAQTSITVPLLAAQDIPVGTVSVEQAADADQLSVTYEITDDAWKLVSTSLYVGEEIPTNNGGNPQVGQFDHQSEHDPAVASHTHEIDASELPTVIKVAAHATVQTEADDDAESEPVTETAWGYGARINQRTNPQGRPAGNWATYFEVVLE